MASEPGILVIADGCLAGLVAIANGADPARLPGWAPKSQTNDEWTRGHAPGRSLAWIVDIPGDETSTARAAAASAQADLFGLSAASGPPVAGTRSNGDAALATRLLIEAALAAGAHGLEAVLWPIHAGTELDLAQIADAINRAVLASRLVSVGRARPIRILAPYVDFTDRQLADVAVDMDLPVWTCWWWDGTAPATEGAGSARPAPAPGVALAEAARLERERWSPPLAAAGWSDPRARAASAPIPAGSSTTSPPDSAKPRANPTPAEPGRPPVVVVRGSPEATPRLAKSGSPAVSSGRKRPAAPPPAARPSPPSPPSRSKP